MEARLADLGGRLGVGKAVVFAPPDASVELLGEALSMGGSEAMADCGRRLGSTLNGVKLDARTLARAVEREPTVGEECTACAVATGGGQKELARAREGRLAALLDAAADGEVFSMSPRVRENQCSPCLTQALGTRNCRGEALSDMLSAVCPSCTSDVDTHR